MTAMWIGTSENSTICSNISAKNVPNDGFKVEVKD